MTSILKNIFGDDFLVIPEFWAWYINKGEDSSGFAPHRDQIKVIPGDDGNQILFSIWIPLVDVDPFNSCMYVVPKTRDRNYPDNLEHHEIRGNDVIWDVLPHDIMALPAKAGSMLAWDANLIHWGGRSTNYAKTPRISYGFSIQKKCSNPIYAAGVSLDAEFPFNQRLQLVATQLKVYSQRYAYADLIKRFIRKHCIDEMIS